MCADAVNPWTISSAHAYELVGQGTSLYVYARFVLGTRTRFGLGGHPLPMRTTLQVAWALFDTRMRGPAGVATRSRLNIEHSSILHGHTVITSVACFGPLVVYAAQIFALDESSDKSRRRMREGLCRILVCSEFLCSLAEFRLFTRRRSTSRLLTLTRKLMSMSLWVTPLDSTDVPPTVLCQRCPRRYPQTIIIQYMLSDP